MKEVKNAQKNPLPLPYVFPLVYYNGEKAYKGARFNLLSYCRYCEQYLEVLNYRFGWTLSSCKAGEMTWRQLKKI